MSNELLFQLKIGIIHVDWGFEGEGVEFFRPSIFLVQSNILHFVFAFHKRLYGMSF